MKFARITRETTTTPVPTILEKIETLQAELTELIESYLSEHMVPGVPQSHVEAWLWGAVRKVQSGPCKCAAVKMIATKSDNS